MLAAKLEGKNAVNALRILCSRAYASPAIEPKRTPPTERPYLPTAAGLKVNGFLIDILITGQLINCFFSSLVCQMDYFW